MILLPAERYLRVKRVCKFLSQVIEKEARIAEINFRGCEQPLDKSRNNLCLPCHRCQSQRMPWGNYHSRLPAMNFDGSDLHERAQQEFASAISLHQVIDCVE